MEKYVPLDKRSKKEKKKFFDAQRKTWDGVNPMTKIINSVKSYNRNRQKTRDRKRQRDEEYWD